MKKLIILALITLVTASMCADEIKLKYSSVTGEDVPMVREYMVLANKLINEVMSYRGETSGIESSIREMINKQEKNSIYYFLYLDFIISNKYPIFYLEMMNVNSKSSSLTSQNLYSREELEYFRLKAFDNCNTSITLNRIVTNSWLICSKNNDHVKLLTTFLSNRNWVKLKVTNCTLLQSKDKKIANIIVKENTLIVNGEIVDSPFDAQNNTKISIIVDMQLFSNCFEKDKEYLINYKPIHISHSRFPAGDYAQKNHSYLIKNFSDFYSCYEFENEHIKKLEKQYSDPHGLRSMRTEGFSLFKSDIDSIEEYSCEEFFSKI